MRTILLVLALLGTTLHAQVTHTLVASDFQFEPDLLTISSGDTVHIILGAGHSFTQVSAGTWNLNQGAPQIGIDAVAASPERVLVRDGAVIDTDPALGDRVQGAANRLRDWLATPEGQRASAVTSPNPGR